MYDILIKNGTVIDGSGKSRFRADVGINGNTITAVGQLNEDSARTVISAEHCFITPGFIDVHAHSDVLMMQCPDPEGKVMQGITCDISGLCGTSLYPAAYLQFQSAEYKYRKMFLPNGIVPLSPSVPFKDFHPHLSAHMPFFIGQGTLRTAVMGLENRIASPKEMQEMKTMLRQYMEEGAFGLSSGLSYIPGSFTSTEELIDLCKELTPFHGIYNTHMRNESSHVIQSIKEAIRIGRESGCRVHISHHKVMGIKNFGKTKQTLALIDQANQDGISVTLDMYPYTAGSVGITSLVPGWVFSDGPDKALEKLSDPSSRSRILQALQQDDWENLLISCTPGRITLCFGKNLNCYEGLSIAQIAADKGLTPEDAVIDLLIQCKGQGTIIFHGLSDEDVERVLRHPNSMVGTDAYARPYSGPLAEGKPHPRNYSGFVHYLKYYIIQKHLLSMEEAIRKLTSYPASVFELGKRGLIAPEYAADITVFNPDQLDECGDFLHPAKAPKGIKYVLVNGVLTVSDSHFTHALGGYIIRHGKDMQCTGSI